MQQIHDYLAEIKRQFHSGHAIEHAYRPALQRLMETFDDVVAVNDPKHSEHGAPDFVFLKQSNNSIIRGYAEAKDITVNLDKTEKTNQMERYAGYTNLVLTDYLEFRFYKNGEKYETVSLGCAKQGNLHLQPENGERLLRELQAFLDLPPESIKSGRRLAQIMGGKARRIRDNVEIYLKSEYVEAHELEKIYEMMKRLLVHDLDETKFADMYAQTLVYGLFVARYGDDTPENFTRSEARDLVPASNPFLRHFFDHIAGAGFDKRLAKIVDELCEIFSVSDVRNIVHRHLRIADNTVRDAKDPIIHFYEDFLQSYDSLERKKMGAYYTPTPVVRFIVRQIDQLLKTEFGVMKGLASSDTITRTVATQPWRKKGERKDRLTRDIVESRVQILDPAVGTATFLNETIRYIYEKNFQSGQAGLWPSYVNDNLIPRLFGFELMMAPYTVAHLKLAMMLRETGVNKLKTRLNVFLTNTLEEGIPIQPDLFSLGLTEAVTEESRLAAEVKSEKPVMVVMGNPPYSAESNNKTDYANSLVDKYKFEPGGLQKLKERNPKWLNDDYVKFIAFAEDMIERNGSGIVGMITNNGFLDNPTFRGMRWYLARTFDKIFVVNLHGNAKKRETAPDGGKDENIFDIMQGVSIMIAVKNNAKQAEFADVYYQDIFGLRQDKFDQLGTELTFEKIKLDQKMFYFMAKDTKGQEEYEKGILLNELMPINSVGIVTGKDDILVDEAGKDLLRKITKYKESYSSGKVYDRLQNAILDEKYIVPMNYRPFDKRCVYYDASVIERSREKVMKNMIGERSEPHTHTHTHTHRLRREENIAMIFKRGLSEDSPSVFVIDSISESRSWSRPGMQGIESVAPLYLKQDENISIGACRQQKTNDGFHHVLASDAIMESSYVSNKTSEISSQFPLFILESEDGRRANFDVEKLQQLFSEVEQPTEESRKVYPEDIFDYIYASLHSPSYREKYKEFLKADFPRVPRPESWAEFWRKAELGGQLRQLHLMKALQIGDYDTTFPKIGDNVVEKVVRDGDQVFINNSQYFGNIPELAWNFYIGGYQPAQKWLKDRRGRVLTANDIDHYQRIIKILLETDKIMKDIG